MGAHLVRGIVRGIYAFALAKLLGPSDYGLFNYCLSWYIAFLSFTNLGLDIILGREIASNRRKAEEIVSLTLTVKMVVTVLVGTISAVSGWLIEDLLEIRLMLLIFSLALVGRSISLWSGSVFTGYEKTRYYFQQEVCFRVIEVVLGVITLFLGGSLVELAIIHMIVWWIQAI